MTTALPSTTRGAPALASALLPAVSPRHLRVALAGCGTVGGALVDLLFALFD